MKSHGIYTNRVPYHFLSTYLDFYMFYYDVNSNLIFNVSKKKSYSKR